jgi:hypothetical protein
MRFQTRYPVDLTNDLKTITRMLSDSFTQ